MPNRSCPCSYGNPCSPDCTCINSVSSMGCRRCCSYGSEEQRKNIANNLIRQEQQTAIHEEQHRIACKILGTSVLTRYNYPQTFGSTAGPFGGIGGAAMTEFMITALVDNDGNAVLFVGGAYVEESVQFSDSGGF